MHHIVPNSILFRLLGVLVIGIGLAGCQTKSATMPAAEKAATSLSAPQWHATFPAPFAWGGEARCIEKAGCRLVLVEHADSQLVLRKFEGRRGAIKELDRHSLGYHPDYARWINDDWVVAAVEKDWSLDLFRIDHNQLIAGPKIDVGFPPRDVIVLSRSDDQYTLLATPYGGTEVVMVEWDLASMSGISKSGEWCKTPWHPAKVTRAPRGQSEGVIIACLDGKKLMYAPIGQLTSPKELASFDAVPRSARPSPSGKWAYVALETGDNNARVNMDSGELQFVPSPPIGGAVSVAPLSDDLVVWGGSRDLFLQRINDSDGAVLETRWLTPSGYPTQLQLVDVDGDDIQDLVVLNSAGKLGDVFYGPLWDHARKEK